MIDPRPIPLAKIAQEGGQSVRRLRELAAAGQFPGAVRIGGEWWYSPIKHMLEEQLAPDRAITTEPEKQPNETQQGNRQHSPSAGKVPRQAPQEWTRRIRPRQANP